MDNGTFTALEQDKDNNGSIVTESEGPATLNTVFNNTNHAITITIKRLHNKSPLGQFKETIVYITDILSDSCEFELYPEWRHSTGEIHYHGAIKIVDYIKWLKSTLPSLKRLGFNCIKKMDNPKKWYEYCNKELHIAKALILDITMPIRKQVVRIKSKNKRGKQYVAYKDWTLPVYKKEYLSDSE